MVAIPTTLVVRDGSIVRVNTKDLEKWKSEGWSLVDGTEPTAGDDADDADDDDDSEDGDDDADDDDTD